METLEERAMKMAEFIEPLIHPDDFDFIDVELCDEEWQEAIDMMNEYALKSDIIFPTSL